MSQFCLHLTTSHLDKPTKTKNSHNQKIGANRYFNTLPTGEALKAFRPMIPSSHPTELYAQCRQKEHHRNTSERKLWKHKKWIITAKAKFKPLGTLTLVLLPTPATDAHACAPGRERERQDDLRRTYTHNKHGRHGMTHKERNMKKEKGDKTQGHTHTQREQGTQRTKTQREPKS